MAHTKAAAVLTAKSDPEDLAQAIRWDEPTGDWLISNAVQVVGGQPEHHSHVLGYAVQSGIVSKAEADAYVATARKLFDASLVALGYTEG